MKTLGLIGGMSWESTVLYYQLINRSVKRRLGGLHSAKLVLFSLDFAEIEAMQTAGQWHEMAAMLSEAGVSLKAAGADCLVICTNTMHKVSESVQAASGLPLLHIADATGARIRDASYKKVGLLGTAFTMSQDFYKRRLTDNFEIDVIVPESKDQEEVHRIIYEELCLGKVEADSRDYYLSVIDKLYTRGAEAIILGCTEITLLVQQIHCDLPLLDTTAIHAETAAEYAVGETR